MPDLTDDQITDAVADEIVERVQASHPDAAGDFRDLLVRAYTRRTLGVKLTLEESGAIIGVAPQRVSEIERRALTRAYTTYLTRYPELF